ncbi:MAG: hypothetical protein ABIP55_11250 [Tepidisphaeraceae bacterium]
MQNILSRTESLTTAATSVVTSRVRELAPPAWAMELCGERFSLATARVADVPGLTPRQLEDQSFAAYVRLAEQIAQSPHRHAVRFWNHVPFITDAADATRDNYMVFNAGRFRAFSELFGGAARFERDIATASATGHWGRDLVIHCLSTDAAGHAVNNPRQVAPYHYSQRFGPLPPCFARATRLDHPQGLLLVGGTASVRGEDSVHADDLTAQLRETFVNLAVLIGAAIGQKLTPATRLDRWLAAFRELRVYFPNRDHAGPIDAAIRERFAGLRRAEFLHADLCRADLLVEIEGVADLSELKRST